MLNRRGFLKYLGVAISTTGGVLSISPKNHIPDIGKMVDKPRKLKAKWTLEAAADYKQMHERWQPIGFDEYVYLLRRYPTRKANRHEKDICVNL